MPAIYQAREFATAGGLTSEMRRRPPRALFRVL